MGNHSGQIPGGPGTTESDKNLVRVPAEHAITLGFANLIAQKQSEPNYFGCYKSTLAVAADVSRLHTFLREDHQSSETSVSTENPASYCDVYLLKHSSCNARLCLCYSCAPPFRSLRRRQISILHIARLSPTCSGSFKSTRAIRQAMKRKAHCFSRLCWIAKAFLPRLSRRSPDAATSLRACAAMERKSPFCSWATSMLWVSNAKNGRSIPSRA